MIIENHNGTKTFLNIRGKRTSSPILLLHGIGADHQMWMEQTKFLSDQGYFVLIPDLLGHGQSSRVDSLELNDWKYQLDELLEQLELDNFILAGTSLGGVLAQYYTIHSPGRIRKLILCDTFGNLKTWREKLLGWSQVLGYRVFQALGRQSLARGMASAYQAPFAWRAKEYFQQQALQADFPQLILARKAINKINAIGKIPGQIPTLVLVGDQFGDWFIQVNKKIAAAIPKARFQILPDAMDPSNLVNPQAYNNAVLQFLEGRS